MTVSRRMKSLWFGGLAALVAALTIGVAAQRGETPPAGIRIPFGGKPAKGNPTPGTPQPDPPNLADRVTLTGCVQAAPKSDGNAGADATDPNTPSDSRFVLVNAERKGVVPAGTGGSTLAANSSSPRYRLEAIESQLSVFVGTKVEISGEIKPPSSSAPARASGNTPTLLVEFVQKISASCS